MTCHLFFYLKKLFSFSLGNCHACGKKRRKEAKGFDKENHPKFKSLVQRTHFHKHKELISIPIFNPLASLKFCRVLPYFWFIYFWVGCRAFHSISLFEFLKGTWVFVHFLQASVIRLVFRRCLRSQIGKAFSC